MAKNNQFQLLRQRRFLPYFITQFLGAFNDNVYRISLMILIAGTYAKADKDQADVLVNVCAALFILPFFLFSALAGELADKYDKAKLIRRIKLAEICIMATAAVAFYLNSVYFLIAILFLMGTQSSFFGPIKYSILPQHLEPHELVGGNGLVEMGTFLAILLGTIVGGTLIALDHSPELAVVVTTVSLAFLGWSASLFIPRARRSNRDSRLKIKWNPITETWKTLKISAKDRGIFLSILGISWFWFYGTSFLTQLPNYNERFLHGDEHVITIMLTVFSVGIGIGSMLCERLSDHRVELGLVPFGAIGLTVFAVDLSFAHGPYPEAEVTVRAFLENLSNWRMLADLLLMGLFGGFYIVPLYVVLQDRSDPKERSRIIASNNIMNALFMAVASVMAIILLKIGLTIPQFFLVIALLNAAITFYIFKIVPEFLMRFIVWVLISLFYRVDKKGMHNIPDKGAAIITCNHVSFLDPLIIMAVVRRPIIFVMDHNIFKVPGLSFLFKAGKCIPIAPAKESVALKEQAFARVDEALKKGQLVGIFPEGGLTPNGEIQPFKPGIDRILESEPVPTIPMALQGMWGSWFSRRHGRAMLHLPRKFIWSKVVIRIGKAISADDYSRDKLQKEIEKLRGNNP